MVEPHIEEIDDDDFNNHPLSSPTSSPPSSSLFLPLPWFSKLFRRKNTQDHAQRASHRSKKADASNEELISDGKSPASSAPTISRYKETITTPGKFYVLIKALNCFNTY